jgi:hypothetical protein
MQNILYINEQNSEILFLSKNNIKIVIEERESSASYILHALTLLCTINSCYYYSNMKMNNNNNNNIRKPYNALIIFKYCLLSTSYNVQI